MSETRVHDPKRYSIRSLMRVTQALPPGTVTFVVGNTINAAVPFVLLPVLTRVLTPEDYGILAIFQILVSTATPLLGLSLSAAVLRAFFDKTIDLSRYTATGMSMVVLAAALVSTALAIGAPFIERLTGYPSEWLWAAVAVPLFQATMMLALTRYQAETKPRAYTVLQVSFTVLNLGIALLLIVGLGFDWRGRVLAQVFVGAAFSVVALILLTHAGWLRASFDRRYVREILSFGLPLIPHVLAGTALTAIDRLVIADVVSVEAVGIYAVGYQFGTIVLIIQTGVDRAWRPWLFERLNAMRSGHDGHDIVRTTYNYWLALLAVSVLVGFAGRPVFAWLVGDEFVEGGVVIFWIALGYALNGMYKTVAGLLFYRRRTSLLALATFTSVLVNLPLTVWLVSIAGIRGAAISTATSFGVLFVLTWAIAARMVDLPWRHATTSVPTKRS